MADDALGFDPASGSGDGGTTVNQNSASGGNGADLDAGAGKGNGSGGFDTAALGTAVARALEAPLGAVARSVEALGNRLAAVETGLRPKGEEGKGLMDDPEGYIQKMIQDGIQRSTGPLFQTILQDGYDSKVGELAEEVDREFGTGTFSDLFQSEFSSIIKDLPAEMRGSAKHMKAAVDGLKGAKFTELAERRAKVETERRKAAAGTGGYQALGAGRSAPVTDRLSPEEEELVGLWAKRIPGYDAKRYLQAKARGGTESAWTAAKAAEAAKARKG